MKNSFYEQTNTTTLPAETTSPAKTARLLLRLLKAAQPVSRIELARRAGVNRSTVTDTFKPLINAKLVREESLESVARQQGRPPIGLVFNNDDEIFAGVSLGVRLSQVGLTTLSGQSLGEAEFETPQNAEDALSLLRTNLSKLLTPFPERRLKVVGVSVPGVIDETRRKLLYAPHLDWRDVDISDSLQNIKTENNLSEDIKVVVENDATAAAVYESRLRLQKTNETALQDFVLIRSGTGIGVGLVKGGEVYRGSGKGRGIAGEFGHMTIVAGGKSCICGNRGCWERYAAAAAASQLYTGDRMQLGAMKPPRFVEIVALAEAGEIRAQRTLEKLGEYLGIGIANVIIGLGVPHIILSGRIVYGWKFLKESVKKAVEQSIAGKLSNWSIEAGEPRGGGLGGALEIAAEEFLDFGFNHVI
ncbi:MAG TPA: ROK family protein [Pyrinomonadaceae bacterium]|jgi:predicted NBD/HSP70 family sugar kinase